MIGIIGPHKGNDAVSDGHVSVVRNYTMILKRKYPEQVLLVDTGDFSKKPISKLAEIFKLCTKSDFILLLLGKKGLRIILPLCILMKKKNYKIIYRAIGGWLPEYVRTDLFMKKLLMQVDEIFVESEVMIKKLAQIGLRDVKYMPNFTMDDNNYSKSKTIADFLEPFMLCTFSSVTPEKGIDMAIDAVIQLNERLGRTAYKLDIYGKFINEKYKDHIMNKISIDEKFGCSYKGVITDNKIEVLGKYHAMLFPTCYKGECKSGSVIESMTAGTPVLASDWNYNSELIEEGKTGYLFDNNDGVLGLIGIIEKYFSDFENACIMSENCIEVSKIYDPQTICIPLFKYIEGGNRV